MSAELNKGSQQVQSAESNLASLNDDLKFQLAQTVVDIAGIADPTPISDVIGAGMSLYTGDFIGAGLSLISIIPYAGDALGKTAKGARTLKKINALKKRIEAAVATTNLAKKLARKSAAAAVRAKRKAEAAKKAADTCTTKKCPLLSNPFGVSRLPADGTWKGTRGNSFWTPDATTKRGQEILKATKGKPIKFNDGYPDFSPYATHRVEIEMTGKKADFTAANKAAGLKNTPDNMTWHHNEDGVTMELVPSKINNNVPHDGGASIVQSPEF
jgi:hypothetical protein